MSGERRRFPAWPLALLAVLGGLFLAAIHALAGGLACDTDTAYCAQAGTQVEYRGRVFTQDGRPASRSRVEFQFESLRDNGGTVSVTGDSAGRYCFPWPRERIVAYVASASEGSSAPPDPRFASVAGGGGTIVLMPPSPELFVRPTDASGVRIVRAGWDAARDAAPGCTQDAGSPPWNRVDDADSNWRVLLGEYLGLAAAALGLLCAVLPRALRRRVAAAALSAAMLDALLFVLVWVTHTL